MPETVYLVDTFSLMFQVYHAIRQPMTGAGGQPTNAVYGFTTDLRYLRNDVKPTHLICALESTEPGVSTPPAALTALESWRRSLRDRE